MLRGIFASSVGLASIEVDPAISTLLVAILNAVAAFLVSRRKRSTRKRRNSRLPPAC